MLLYNIQYSYNGESSIYRYVLFANESQHKSPFHKFPFIFNGAQNTNV